MSQRDWPQTQWDAAVEEECRQLVRLAVREDLDRSYDWTTVALVPSDAQASAEIVARQAGVLAGLPAVQVVLDEYDPALVYEPAAQDGQEVAAGQVVGTLRGAARSLLTAERPLLNFLGHLSGIATLTREYVQAVRGTAARIYDTRKTLPGYRRLQKYAVRCGGGLNHRLGLCDGVLVKDNHLAWGATGGGFTPAAALGRVREVLAGLPAEDPHRALLIEIEVDRLEQLAAVLPERPDLVLLDNMSPTQLRQCVELRNRLAPDVELEASGGVSLATVRAIAESGVERISVGKLTHSAQWQDVALDWRLT